MWVIGGRGKENEFQNNDAWYSTDGVNWTKAINYKSYPPRERNTALVYNNKMWVMGGFPDGNDVWYSP
jgi:leucine-zipper-like transcriptional regulator 1